MGTAAGAKKAREALALKRRRRGGRTDRPDILTFVTDPRYLGHSIGERLSVAQRTLLKGCYGLPLTAEELAVWQAATQRDYPALEFLEVTVVAGSRAGKDGRFLAPVLLYEALFGTFTVNDEDHPHPPSSARLLTACGRSTRRRDLHAAPSL